MLTNEKPCHTIQMISFKICVGLLLYQHLFSIVISAPGERNKNCPGPMIRMDNGGILQSHTLFGRVPYSNYYDCTWLIKAPPSYKIMIQFNFINIEEEQHCEYDYIELIESNEKCAKICGNNDNRRFISLGNTCLVKFHSDEAVNLEGFSLRYWFVNTSVETLPLHKIASTCMSSEWQCSDDRTCIQKEWVCDGIRDCKDNSDEMKCEFKRYCHQSQVTCGNGNCVAMEKWCNRNKVDCPGQSDDSSCDKTINRTLIIPDSTLDFHRCSVQPIKPKNINTLDDNPQIVGGEEAVPGSWPWVASLRFGSSHYCGATLVSPTWAVTAAHCFENYGNVENFLLDLGRHYVDNDGHNERHKLTKIIIHPQYNAGTIQNDIALIQLSKKAKLTSRVQTVCLTTSISGPKDKQRCVILGWGITKGTGNEGVLKQAILPIVEQKVCNSIYKDVTDGMICAGYEEGGVDACQLDSGGPLLCLHNGSFELTGITSWGEGCALPRKPGVYTNVAKYTTWIKEIVKDIYPSET